MHGSWKLGVLVPVVVMGFSMPVTARAGQSGHEDGATFTKDVLPILQRSCQKCHRPGTGAPMSLLTYEQTRPWAKAIKDRVVTRQMPPWHVDRSIGNFDADRPVAERRRDRDGFRLGGSWCPTWKPGGRGVAAPA